MAKIIKVAKGDNTSYFEVFLKGGASTRQFIAKGDVNKLSSKYEAKTMVEADLTQDNQFEEFDLSKDVAAPAPAPVVTPAAEAEAAKIVESKPTTTFPSASFPTGKK